MRISTVPQKSPFMKAFSRTSAPIVRQRSNRGSGTGLRLNNRKEAGYVLTVGELHIAQAVCAAVALFSMWPLISGLRHRSFGSILQGSSYTLVFVSALGCLTFNAAPWLGVSLAGFGAGLVLALVSHFVDLRTKRTRS
jgi:hypothetical protein